jgi:hypothetical protein
MLLPENTRPATAHSALDDARAQLEDVLRYLRLADGVTAPEVPRHG